MRLELVEWDDAIAEGGWADHGQGSKPHRCQTIGVVTVDEPTHIVIGGTWAELDGVVQTNNRMTIPRGFIVSRSVLDLTVLRGKAALKILKLSTRRKQRSR